MVILFFANIFLVGIWLYFLFSKINVIKYALYLCNIFLGEYCLISVFFLTIDLFSVFRVLIILLIINSIIVLRAAKNKKIPSFEFSKEELIFIALFLVLIPFISVKSETLRTGGDVGFYYSKAIDLMYNDTNNVKSIECNSELSPQMLQSKIDLLNQQYYNVNVSEQKVTYTYHSLYIWPALLALFGSVFGMENIQIVLTILFALAIGNMWYILKRESSVMYAKYIVFPLFGFAPIMIYLTKMTFSEMLFIVILSAGMLFLSDKEKLWKIMCGIFWGLLEAIHFSAFLYLPVLLLILVYFGVIYRKKIYFIISQIVLVEFFTFLICNFFMSPDYSRNQIVACFGNRFSCKVWLTIIALFVACSLVFLWVLIKNIKLFEKMSKLCNLVREKKLYIIICLLVFFIAGVIYKGYILGFTDKMTSGTGSWAGRANYANQGLDSLWHTNIYSICIGLSYIGLPFIIYKTIFGKKWDEKKFTFSLAFLYACLLYTYVRSDNPSNYYGSRYFAIFLIPVGIMLIGSLIENKKQFILIAFVAVITAFPFSMFLKSEVGYKGSCEILNDTMASISEGAVVILQTNQNDIQILASNLQEINSNEVFGEGALEDVSKYYQNSEIFIVTNTVQENSGYEEVMHNKYTVGTDIACFDNFITIAKYPLSSKYLEEEIYVYKIH